MRSCLALVLLLSACTPAYPGEGDGTFDVVGALEENTCGETALPAVDPMIFMVELRSDGTGQAFWRRPSSPVVAGTNLDGSYRFRFTTGIPVYAGDEALGTPGCALIQEESVWVAIDAPAASDAGPGDAAADDSAVDAGENADAGSDASDLDAGASASFSGTDDIQLTVAPGYDCSALVGSAGGPFLALPCGVSYSLSGSPRSPF